MNYSTGYAMNTDELFLSFPAKKMELSTKACEELIGNRHKEYIAKLIFKNALDLVLKDIIENGVTFNLPTRSRKAELFIKRFDGDLFILARKHGKWQDIDFLTTDFAAYQMIFKFQSQGVMREKLVYLNPKLRDSITKNANNGKLYY